MTHLTGSIDVAATPQELLSIQSEIHLVSIDSDLLFTHDRTLATYQALRELGAHVTLSTLYSPHGHDAFLMEYEQLNKIILPHFAL